MYQFVDLSPAQQLARREYLDFYAALAQISVLVPLLVLQLSFLVSWTWRRLRRRAADIELPSSPHRKSRSIGASFGGRFSSKVGGEGVLSRLSRWAWAAGDPVEVLGAYLGTKGEVVGAIAWLAWLLALCFAQTGEDYLHLTKRFGIVAASQLPLHYLLAMKSPYSPVQWLTRSSHETLNSIHQLLGRIIITLLSLHAIFYLNFYVQANLLATKLTQFYVICGIIGIISFTTVGTTALSPVRKWNYRVFYITHVVLATALLPILWFHVSHIRIYLYETAVIYGLNAVFRWLNSTTLSGTVKMVDSTSLMDVRISVAAASEKPNYARWQPGQHAYLSLAGHPLSRTFRSNPFTVSSIPSVDGEIRFVARLLDGNTTKLAQHATSQAQKLTIEGPYGVSNHSENLLRYDRVLFVAGGVGATFIVPLYRQLLADLSPSKNSHRRQKISFVWVARSMADVAWAIPDDRIEREGFFERLKVCLTKDVSSTTANTSSAIGADEDDDRPAYAETAEGIEMEEHKNLLANEGNSDGKVTAASIAKTPSVLATYAGRPDLRRLVDQVFTHGNAENIAVVVCGPQTLGRGLRREVGRWVGKGRNVWFWEESFAL